MPQLTASTSFHSVRSMGVEQMIVVTCGWPPARTMSSFSLAVRVLATRSEPIENGSSA